MKPDDLAGRINRQAFMVSTSTLFAIVLISLILRFLVRIRVQKQFAIDDGFLILGMCCFITAMATMYTTTMDRMYMLVALQTHAPGVIPPQDWLQESYEFHKWVTVVLILAWCAIAAVKFSILFFFKKLIDRFQSLNVFWCITVVFNTGALGYGISVYYVCPYGAGKTLLLSHAIAQIASDVVGDLLILCIPICVIWKIQVHWTQKIVLMFSLCLTIFMITITIIRVSGMVSNGVVDIIWEVYWLILAAEVGLIMAAAIAFRIFFVAWNNRKTSPPEQVQRFFRESFANRFRRGWRSQSEDTEELGNHLPAIPRAQMTGMRTFIDAQGVSFDEYKA
ncbi:hypothetical protein K469DRAFT_722941 [Zopfia rhizophila CBS 207.26]|uniref:Rhodopsin domain-containing protein n=1 Tax=Zopfia rhizophila CBS 207.26 TaxID=1314779 RepID=A0A6A6EEP7_9PEZI|nr:hypothetical protein K469DRAFT_722941 [Zopfia rhizophila CBS 207.26]